MIKIIKNLFSSIAHNLLNTVIVGIVTVPLLVSVATGTFQSLWVFVNKPVPIWVFIILTVLLPLMYPTLKKLLSRRENVTSKTFLMSDSGLKWRVVDHMNGHCSVDQSPFCEQHDYQYIQTKAGQHLCRESMNSQCDSPILDHDEIQLKWELAKSKANGVVSKLETKH